MKILWFTLTTSLYKNTSNNGYNGGGWIESLEQILSEEKNIDLAVSFFHTDSCFKSKHGNTTYYPISLYNSVLNKIKHNLFYAKYDAVEVRSLLRVIDDFKPDIIHVFGSENSFGLITAHTNVPVVIHIQGLLNPCLNAYYAPGSNELDIIKQNIFKPYALFSKLLVMSFFKLNTKREAIILQNSKYFIGRTNWDKDVTSLYSKQASYFYCSEVLRDPFYSAAAWQFKEHEKMIIVSTISKTSYKGFDLILKTAKLLKELSTVEFEWNVFGVDEYKIWEKKLGIRCEDVNVHLKGVVDSSTLVENIQKSSVFVHSSYIDNSPNSLCEAQMLGAPVISTNVGGISSLIENEKTGFLVPANDPYSLAQKIIQLKNNPTQAEIIAKNARIIALIRHDRETIKNNLLNIYNVMNDAKTNSESL